VLNFFADLKPVIEEAARIIKPGGIFGFTVEGKGPGQESRYTIRVDGGSGQDEEPFEIAMYRHSDEHVGALLESAGFFVRKDFEFLADRYPEQGIEVYLTAYVAQKA
jgi:predicted TPR repeat methyltransferase